MQILTVVAPVFASNCYVLVADDGTCVVVDPGAGVTERVRAVVDARGLRPVAVLVTHAHADHHWDAADLADGWGVPVHLHVADADRLADPLAVLYPGGSAGRATADLSGAMASALAAADRRPEDYRVPQSVEPFGTPAGPTGPVGPGARPAPTSRTPDATLTLGGLTVVARHAPGHTPGATLYLIDTQDGPVALTGDVLFAGTVGRTDLPGGDPAAMTATLREVVATLPRGTVVLPGHGPASRMDVELATNPYLAG
ncbi:MBL fold metallo-hydrolase [Cellulomonas hominis]